MDNPQTSAPTPRSTSRSVPCRSRLEARAKAVFIALYPAIALAITARAGWALWRGQPIVVWASALLTTVPLLALLVRWLVLRDVARMSPHLPIVNALAVAAVGVTVSSLWCAVPHAAEAATLAGAGAVLSGMYTCWYSRLGRSRSAKLTVGHQLPPFQLRSIDGAAVSNAALFGRPALLMFYRGNWCPLCQAQIREIAARYRELTALGVRVVLISPQPETHTRALAERFQVSYEYWVDVDNRLARALGIEAKDGVPMGMELLGYERDTVLPTVIVLDRRGEVRWVHETDNYRVRPEPEAFLPLLRELARAQQS